MLESLCLLLPDHLKKNVQMNRSLFESILFYKDETFIKDIIAKSFCESFVYIGSHVNFFFDMEYFLSQINSSSAVALSYGINRGELMASLGINGQIETFDKKSLHYHDGYHPAGILYFTRDRKDLLFSEKIIQAQGIPLPIMKKKDDLRPALFLDRDGVIIHDHGYVHLPEQVDLYEEIIPLIQFANHQKWWVLVVSNQAGVAHGKYPTSHVEKLHHYLEDILASKNAFIDDWIYCPFHSDGKGEFKKKSLLRKPEPGMVLKACEKYPVDLQRSFMVGDKVSDEIKLPGPKGFLMQRNYNLTEAKWPVFSNYNDILQELQNRQ